MQFFTTVIECYQWQGLALLLAIVILFCVQFYYYGIAYRRICRYRLTRTLKQRRNRPPVSVVVPLYGENRDFVDERLPRLFEQDYHHYEIVVVYVGSDCEFYEDLRMMSVRFENLSTTQIKADSRFPISIKMALNLGIKLAHNDCLLFTTPDAMPRDNEWITYMACGFERAQVVLAYSSLTRRGRRIYDYLTRMVEFHSAQEWLSAAVAGRPYRASHVNFGFTRKVYDSARGFDHLNMNIGHNDLFIEHVTRSRRAAVILSPHAAVDETRWGGWHWWWKRMRYYGSAYALYPRAARNFSEWETGSRLLFFASVATALAVLPYELKIAAAVLLAVRYAIVWNTTRQVARRIGERGILTMLWLYDTAGLVLHYAVRVSLLRKNPDVWR